VGLGRRGEADEAGADVGRRERRLGEQHALAAGFIAERARRVDAVVGGA
jgi:hypothetical protein